MFADTGCAGVMVGRGAIANPWLLRQIADWLEGKEPFVPAPADWRDAIDAYFGEIEAAFATATGALGRFKMLMSRLAPALRGGGDLRQRVLRARTPAEAREAVAEHFTQAAA